MAALAWLTKNRSATSPAHADPALRPRFFPFALKTVEAALRHAVSALGNWHIAADDGGAMRLERATRIMRFVDDVTVTLGAHPAGTVVDIASASRVGLGDFGQNRRNILEAYDALGVELMDVKPRAGDSGLLYCHYTPRPFKTAAPLFFDPAVAPLITPAALRARIVSIPENISVGAKLTLEASGLFTWVAEITEWNPPYASTDKMLSGPFASFVHRLSVAEAPGGTVISDRTHYRPLASPLMGLFTSGWLTAMFAERARLLDNYLDTRA